MQSLPLLPLIQIQVQLRKQCLNVVREAVVCDSTLKQFGNSKKVEQQLMEKVALSPLAAINVIYIR